MVALLLIISFLIHVLTVIGLFNLMKQLTQLKSNHTSEIDELLSTYLQEIKDENDRLQEELLQKKPIIETSIMKKDMDMNDYHNHQQQSLNESYHKQTTNGVMPTKQKLDVIETSIEAKALQLHNAGHSVTQIARKLDRGTTEISLIIEMNKRENVK